MRYLFIMGLLSFTITSFGQSVLQRKIASVKQNNIPFENINLFNYQSSKSVAGKGIYHEIGVDPTIINNILESAPYAITFNIAVSQNRSETVELVYYSLDEYKVKVNNSTYTTDYVKPVHYRGVIKNRYEPTTVVLTISKTFVTMFIADKSAKYSFIQKQQGENNRSLVLYNKEEIILPKSNQICGLDKITTPETPLSPSILLNTQAPTDASSKCIYGYLDCTNNLFINRGSNVQNCIDYITAIYNDVSTAYLNETINAKISEINIWTVADPFIHTTRDTAIYTFAKYYQNNFYGNFAVMLDRTSGGISGLAGGFGKMKSFLPNTCGKFVDDPVNKLVGQFCICDMNYFGDYSNYPVPANDEQVYIITHEIGHLVNGRHTHDGGYVVTQSPLVYGSLDTCGGKVFPTAGLSITNGTFMSYCIFSGMNMNFNAGFGTQPGNEIRNFVSNETCLHSCVACVFNVTITNLPSGLTRYEVNNSITANGTIPAAGTVYLDAGNYIDLKPGFAAVSGSRVQVFTDGCGGIR